MTISVISIRIDDKQHKALKIIASVEGRTMGGIVSSLIEDYIDENKVKLAGLTDNESLSAIAGLSESSFMEWDNEEDAIYDNL